MNGDNKTVVIPPLAEIQAQALAHREAVAQANSTPLPGPLRDVFSIVPDIAVGQFKVRPLCDADFEILQALDHPLYKMSFGGIEYGNKPGDLRGKTAWQGCYLLTRPIEEIEGLTAGGLDKLEAEAKKTFSWLKMAELVEIMKAVFRQVAIYWSPVLGYQECQPEPEEGGERIIKKNSSVEEAQTC